LNQFLGGQPGALLRRVRANSVIGIGQLGSKSVQDTNWRGCRGRERSDQRRLKNWATV